MTASIEDHRLVLLVAAHQLFARALAEPFHQHRESLPHILAVALGRNLGLQGNELVQAPYLLFLGHVVGQMLGSIGTGTLGVFEHEGRVETHLAHQRERLLEVVFGLIAIAHKHIGGQSAAWNDAADSLHLTKVVFAGVFAVHQVQRVVAAALHREVDVLAQVGLLGNGVQDVLGHILGIRGGEPHPHLRHLAGYPSQQFGKARTSRHGLSCRTQTVAVDILAQQRHLFESTVTQVAHLGEDALHVARPLTATGKGHNAIVTEVITAAHDAHETANLGSVDALRKDVAIGLGGRQLYIDGLMTGLALGNEVGERQIGIGTGHQVGMMVLQQVAFHALSHTAQHADDESRTLFFQPAPALGIKSLQTVIDFLLGIVAHRTGVQEHGISDVQLLGHFISGHLHHRGNHLRVGHIHLATVCFDI